VSIKTPVARPSASRWTLRLGAQGSAEPGAHECVLVREPGVPVDAPHEDGVVRHGRGERAVMREGLPGPQVLIPTATRHPLALAQLDGALLDARDHFLEGLRTAQFNLVQLRSESLDVPVGILQSRQGESAAQVVSRNSGEVVLGLELGQRPGGDDDTVAHEERVDDPRRLAGAAGHDLAAVKDVVIRTSLARGEGDGERERESE